MGDELNNKICLYASLFFSFVVAAVLVIDNVLLHKEETKKRSDLPTLMPKEYSSSNQIEKSDSLLSNSSNELIHYNVSGQISNASAEEI